MSRPKIPRKSTAIDMTAMCDVAFLLLSFFILVTKFKPSEAVPVHTPTSVASKVAPDKNVIMISLNKDQKVFFSTSDNNDDKDMKQQIIEQLNTEKGLGLSGGEIAALTKAPFIGVAFAQLKQQASLPEAQMNGEALPGIPTRDTSNNELIDWMRAVQTVYSGSGKVPNILLKGDNVATYPVFKNIITAFKKNDFSKFQMVTNPAGVQMGSDLYKQSMAGKKSEE